MTADPERPAREAARAQGAGKALPEIVRAPDLIARDEILARAGRVADENRPAVDGQYEGGVAGAPQPGVGRRREKGRQVTGQPCARARAVVEGAAERDHADEPGGIGRVARSPLAFPQFGALIHRRSMPNTQAMAEHLLAYRAPLAREALLRFLELRATPGVEEIDGDTYRRVVSVEGRTGVLRARLPAERDVVELHLDDAVDRAPVRDGARRVFDVDADPIAIDRTLAADPRLRPLVEATPGLRLPGALDGFEIAVRAIIGQQISVAAARTITGRLAAMLGDPLATDISGLGVAFPRPEAVAASSLEGLGMPSARRATLITARPRDLRRGARSLARGRSRRCTPGPARPAGVGPWTADYIALRALGDRDAFLPSDLVIRQVLGEAGAPISAREAEERSAAVAAMARLRRGPPLGIGARETRNGAPLTGPRSSEIYLVRSFDGVARLVAGLAGLALGLVEHALALLLVVAGEVTLRLLAPALGLVQLALRLLFDAHVEPPLWFVGAPCPVDRARAAARTRPTSRDEAHRRARASCRIHGEIVPAALIR